MEGLYPIIRRQRRPLLPPDEPKLVADVAAKETNVDGENNSYKAPKDFAGKIVERGEKTVGVRGSEKSPGAASVGTSK